MDMTPAMIARETKPKPTWFVRRLGDGMEFAVEEKEAWDILYNQSSWKRRDFQFFGYSDGKTYQKIVKESMTTASRLEPLIAAKKAEVQRYISLEDKMMMDEIVDMEGDPSDAVNEANKGKVLRLQKIRTRLEDELEKLETEHRGATAGIVRTATEAEKKVAMKNWKERKTWPDADLNAITPNASPRERAKILGSSMIG